MTLKLGDTAPDFEQDSSIGKIRFHEWAGDSWVVLFSHPADFTPVCTTELGLTAKLKPEFDKRNVKAIALSVDPADKHTSWIKDIEETQKTVVGFPIVADADKSVSTLYDMIHPNQSETVATPGNWKDGDDVIIPLSVQDEAVIKQKYPKGYRSPKPYLRITPQPNK